MFGGWLTSSSSSNSSKKIEKKPKTKREEWLALYEEQPAEWRIACTLAAGSVVGSLATLVLVKFYARYLRRYPTHEWITPNLYAKKRWIKGIVTSVGDPDGFRLYHTPGLVFIWKYWKGIPQGMRALKDQTISIRLAGIDAPEYGHFSKDSQPYSREAYDWLKEKVLGRVVYCQLLKRDQYARAVAAVMLPRDVRRSFVTPILGTSLADEMLRAGLAVTYTDSGAVYGRGGLEGHLALEAEAKKQRRGQWVNGTNVETPSEYKRRHRSAFASEGSAAESEVESEGVLNVEDAIGGKKGILRSLRQFFSKFGL